MWKNLLVIISLFGVCGVFWFGFVFGGNIVFNPEIRFRMSVSDDIYMNSDVLNKNVLVYQSNVDITNATISSLCNINSEFLASQDELYFFSVDYTNDTECKNGNVVLTLGEDSYANTIHKLNLISDISLYSNYIDYSTPKLKEYQSSLKSDIDAFSIFKNYKQNDIIKYFKFHVGQKVYQNRVYENSIIDDILSAREEKYLVPVVWRDFTDQHHKIPNSGRWYRAAYTDGIHHAWDIDWVLWDELLALDNGIIVRVVDDFTDSDFSRIVYGANLSEEQELKNLDILRGNQVWIKTMKWEVVFYSHLDFVEGDIVEGSVVQRGDIIWKMWVSWVPEEWYDDYHLHFAVMKNPYDFLKAGTYDFGDYMAWDWLWKWKSYNELVQLRKDTFE